MWLDKKTLDKPLSSGEVQEDVEPKAPEWKANTKRQSNGCLMKNRVPKYMEAMKRRARGRQNTFHMQHHHLAEAEWGYQREMQGGVGDGGGLMNRQLKSNMKKRGMLVSAGKRRCTFFEERRCNLEL